MANKVNLSVDSLTKRQLLISLKDRAQLYTAQYRQTERLKQAYRQAQEQL